MRFSKMIHAVDLHACGEHGRVIVGGVADVPGSSMFEKMTYLRDSKDWVRLMMLREPRGYPAANVQPAAAAHRARGRRRLRDHGAGRVPADVRARTRSASSPTLLETGMLEHARAGHGAHAGDAGRDRARASATCRDGKVTAVEFRNVPAFAAHLDQPVEVPHLGTVTVDVGWGGMFYVIADAGQLGLELVPGNGGEIVRVTEMIKAAAAEQLPVVHPENPEHPRHHDRPAVRAVAEPGRLAAQRRDRLDRPARLGPAGHVDGRDRPLAVRHRHVRRDGRACTPRGSSRSARRSSTRASSAPCSRAGWWRRRRVGGRSRGGADDRRPGVDHRLRAVRARPDRPVPGRVHAR